MAIESVEANSGSGGATFATDAITGSVQVPYVKLMSGADTAEDLIAGDAANGLDVDVTRVSGTVAVSNAGLTELAAAINASSQMDVNIAASNATVAVSNAGITTIAGAVSGTEMQVDVLTLPNVTLAAGTNTNEVVGDGAHDSAIAGNPIRVGARGISADYTAVTTGDTADLITTLLGKLVVMPFALPGASWSYASPAAVTDTADDEAKAAGAAGVRHYITGCQVFNADDTVGTEVVIKDGSTVLWRGWCEQTGGGASAVFNPPLRGTAATAVNVANITTSAETYFNLQGFSASE